MLQITDAFVTELRRVIEEMFGTDPQSSASFGRIINERHLHRIEALLQEVQVVHGGRIDAADLYVEPTIVLNPPADSALMRDEVGGLSFVRSFVAAASCFLLLLVTFARSARVDLWAHIAVDSISRASSSD